jgi:hypothetical protein
MGRSPVRRTTAAQTAERFEPCDFIASEDKVVVLGVQRWRVNSTGTRTVGQLETLAGMPRRPLKRLVRPWQQTFAGGTRFARRRPK